MVPIGEIKMNIVSHSAACDICCRYSSINESPILLSLASASHELLSACILAR